LDNKQIVNMPLWEEIVILEGKNPVKANRNVELALIITPSKNYYKVYPWSGFYNKKVFDKFEKALNFFNGVIKK